MNEFDNQNTPDITNTTNHTSAADEPTPQPQYTQPSYSTPNQPIYNQPPVTPVSPTPKSKIAAGLLGIFLGSLGVHNFYLGYTGKAIAQLLITLLTCGIGGIASGIWGLIEGILILTGSIAVDGNGLPLVD